MRRSIQIFFTGLSLVTSLYALETFTDNVNPFNEYMNPENGVNLYSGDAAFEELLYTLPGRGNNMDIPIALKYSSNVHLNARTRNDIAPASWVGLGWRLSYGAINCNHKGTKTHDDDDFTYITPEGVARKIKKFQGLNFSLYHGSGWGSVPDFSTLTPDFTGKINNFNIDLRDDEKNFACRFEGTIKISASGDYGFYVNSDDGSNLYIKKNGQWVKVVNNDGLHTAQERNGLITLSKGYYEIRVDYFNKDGSYNLNVTYTGPNISKIAIPDSVLFPCEQNEKIRRWYIENDPYTKAEPQDVNGDGIYDGWIITRIDGSQLLYGDLNFSGRNATRFTFRWGDYVGPGLDGNPELYPYQWDLSAKRDLAGNEVKFEYFQTKEPLKSGSWDTRDIGIQKYYTKASYLSRITSPQGGKVDFIRGRHNDLGAYIKDPSEYFDQNVLKGEPDGVMEFYEDLSLRSIKIYEPSGSLVSSFKFDYEMINTAMTGSYAKRLLTSISEYGLNTKFYRKRLYSYNTDQNSADENNSAYDPDYNYGAISDRITAQGEHIKYYYNRKSMVNLNETAITDDNAWILALYSGMTSQNNPFCISQKGMYNHNYWAVYNWDGGAWVEQTYLPETPMGNDLNQIIVYTGLDYMVLRGGANEDLLMIYNWDGEKWKNTFSRKDMTSGTDRIDIYPGNDYFAIRSGDKGGIMEIWNWNGVNWSNTFLKENLSNCNDCTIKISCGTNFIAVRSGQNKDLLSIYDWNGTSWVIDNFYNKKDITSSDDSIDVQAFNNYVTVKSGEHSELLKVIQKKGSGWLQTYPKTGQGEDLSNGGMNDIEIFPGSNFIAVRTGANDDLLTMVNWNGEDWVLDPVYLRKDMTPDEDRVTYYPGNDFVTMLRGVYRVHIRPFEKRETTSWNTIGMLGWNGRQWEETMGWLQIGWSYQDMLIAQGGNHISTYTTYDQADYDMWTDNRNTLDRYYSFVWNGKEWVQALAENEYITFDEYRIKGQMTANASFVAYTISRSRNDYPPSPVFLSKVFANKLGKDIYTYAVTKTVKRDGVSSPVTFNYDYDELSGMYDTQHSTAKFNKVKITIPGNGYIEKYFFNDSKNNGQDAYSNYDKLDGYVYKTNVYNDDGLLIQDERSSYWYNEDPAHWPVGIYNIALSSKETNLSHVITNQENVFNGSNGLPQMTKAINSDNKERLISTKFAHEWGYENAMDHNGAYMLSQPCEIDVQGREPGVVWNHTP